MRNRQVLNSDVHALNKILRFGVIGEPFEGPEVEVPLRDREG
jgi:hypothetical protein